MLTIVWTILVIVAPIIFVLFTFVVAFGAPFLPTLKARVPEALDLINLKKGQTLLELGSGDGRVLKEAASRGLYAIGYELNPLLVLYSKINTFSQRKNIKIKWGNYWRSTWPAADGVFVFLLQPYMEKLSKKIEQQYSDRPVSLVSFAFTINSKKPAKENNGLYLYRYNTKLKKR